MMIYYLYVHSYMFRSYDHYQAEKYIATLGLLIAIALFNHVFCLLHRLHRVKCGMIMANNWQKHGLVQVTS
jgi:hypothetical protein